MFRSNKERTKNIIDNPHTASLFLHERFTIFREEVIERLFHVNDYWYRFEWQHRGSGHIHGFIWIPGAPDMDKLDWHNHAEVEEARKFFDKYVTAWNPRTSSSRNNTQHRSLQEDPCLLETNTIFSRDVHIDYEELINRVQRNTQCTEATCLRKQGNILECCYKAPLVRKC